MKKSILIIAMLLGMATFCAAQSHVDVVYLKDGSVIRGLVVEQIPDKSIKIETYDGSLFVYNMDQVEKITKELNRRQRRQHLPRNVKVYTDYNQSLRGYKGFIDGGYNFGDDGNIEFSTSHGYQFNNHIFVGGGLALRYYSDYEVTSVPFFANFRANFINNSITPFVDVKTGYAVGDIEGFYASIGLGMRIKLQNRMALNLTVTYSGQEDGYFYHDYWDDYHYESDYSVEGFGLKIGLEF